MFTLTFHVDLIVHWLPLVARLIGEGNLQRHPPVHMCACPVILIDHCFGGGPNIRGIGGIHNIEIKPGGPDVCEQLVWPFELFL